MLSRFLCYKQEAKKKDVEKSVKKYIKILPTYILLSWQKQSHEVKVIYNNSTYKTFSKIIKKLINGTESEMLIRKQRTQPTREKYMYVEYAPWNLTV